MIAHAVDVLYPVYVPKHTHISAHRSPSRFQRFLFRLAKRALSTV